MCGIFAYVIHRQSRSREHILQTLLQGLRSMEYAGCDSVGIGMDDPDQPSGVALLRAVGDVNVLEKVCISQMSPRILRDVVCTHVGLAHMRWATHGAPAEVNAHPQSSGPDHGFLVVHNGILPNYQAIRLLLEARGHCFQSETDTEVIAKLCQYFYNKAPGSTTFPEIVLDAVSQLQGPYGIVVKSSHFPGEMVATKRGSQLLLATVYPPAGVEAPDAIEVYVSSHAAGLVSHSVHLVCLEDEDLVHVKDGAVTIYNVRDQLCAMSPPVRPSMLKVPSALASPPAIMYRGLFPRPRLWSPCCSPSPLTVYPSFSPPVASSPDTYAFSATSRPQALLRPISRQAQVLDMELDAVMKGTFPHFLLKEIFEQPESLKNTMRGRLSARNGTVLLGGLVPYRETLCKARRLIFIATGSAYYGALAVRTTLEEMVAVPIQLELATDFTDRCPPVFRDDACCFISHTGENIDVLNALHYCHSKGALCVGFTNQVGSSLGRSTDCGVYLHAGFEMGVTSTKAFSSEVLALLMFALMLSEDRIDLAAQRLEIIKEMQRLPAAVYDTLQALREPMEEIAKEFQHMSNFLFMARGSQIATCLEGALKLNETAHVHGEGIHLGELKHGPLALVDAEMPVMLICTRDHSAGMAHDDREALYPKAKGSLQQVLARRGRPVVIVNDEDLEITESVHRVVQVPRVMGCLETIINILPFQLLAYYLGVLRGHDVDGPRYVEN